MLLLANAPMLAMLGGLIASLAVSDLVNNLYLLFTAPLFTAGLLFCSNCDNKKFKIRGQPQVFLIIMILVIIFSARFFYVFNKPESDKYHHVKAIGTVESVRPWGRNYRAVINTDQGNFLISIYMPFLISGETVEIEGYITPLKHSKTGFSELRYWRARGVDAKISRLKIKQLDIDKFSLAYLRFKILRFINLKMPRFTGAYLRAVWLGERDPDISNAHRSWDTSHLLAVSGFHVGIAAFIASLIFGRRRIILISIFLWAYVLLTGAAPSALRAALMFQAAMLSGLIGRPANRVNAVCTAAVILLFYSPYLFYDIGWRLSVIAALTLTALFNFIEIKNNFIKLILLTPTVVLTTYPQSSRLFDGVPLAGLVFNLFAPAFFSIAFSISSISAILYYLKIPFAEYLIDASEANFACFHKIADKILYLIPILNYKIPWRTPYAFGAAFMLIFILCRAVKIPSYRSIIIATGGAAFALIIFI